MTDRGPEDPKPPRRPRPEDGNRPRRARPGPVEPTDADFDQWAAEVSGPAGTARSRIDKRTIRRLLIAVVALVAVIAVVTVIYRQFMPSGTPGDEITLEVPEGATLPQIATILADADVVPSALAVRVQTRLDSAEDSFQAGEYSFQSNSSVSKALEVLRAGAKVRTDRITIPEGFRVRQIADRVGTIEGMSADAFYEAATNGSVRSRYQPEGSTSLEGFLFPDTYLLAQGESEESLLQQMVNQADDQARLLGLDNSLSRISKTPYETMIIASMIESEAKTDGDRAKISRVIENRLFDAMKLQIDATVLYGIGNTKDSLTTGDLQRDSDWNTYTRAGLPATPISNPGRASIEAALNPAEGNWLYYVLTDEQGNHFFTDSYDEHQQKAQEARDKGLY